MRFRQILILAREEHDLIPEVFVELALQSVANTFRFANVDRRFTALGVVTSEEIHARFLRLFTSEHAVKFAPRTGDGFAGPV